jgi:hypothetical protein
MSQTAMDRVMLFGKKKKKRTHKVDFDVQSKIAIEYITNKPTQVK